ncbi:DUF4082 domain-containing protein [Actinoplanes sp. Pm04-4]|uniref:DUF4082 domain-containing protein n=1 Tax=Paractinoplanes pyxinae TaxID=2997416 RepID=A0ABT4AVD7_9ACTN|nr:DUF4082 domain-containing protein [Actinoplanes pyxinae]MCY1138196.1 DUF4082 domain-containing protein [Actinoplanes pyxinae]
MRNSQESAEEIRSRSGHRGHRGHRGHPGRHVRGGRRGRLLFTTGAALMLAAATVVTANAVTTQPETYSFFTGTDVSKVATDPDTVPVELGLKFRSSRAGTLTAVRFLKASGDRGAHRVTVWSGSGRRLAGATSAGESPAGWQQVALAQPLRIDPGRDYTVSFQTTRYRASENYFAGRTAKAGPISTVGAGVFAYGPTRHPTSSWKASNYWVDVVFQPGGSAPPTAPATTTRAPSSSPAPSPVPSPTPSVTPSSPSTPTTPPAQPVGLDLPRVPWEGGPEYYGRFAPAKAGFTDSGFFPVGVWFESVLGDEDAATDKAAGINTYVELTENSDLATVRKAGMHALTSWESGSRGDESVGWVLTDEPDMWAGPGDGQWTGKFPGQGDVCATKEPCGYDVLRRISAGLPGDTRLRYVNYGKGVMFWESDAEAAAFVNQFTSIVSNDIYWYTDPNVCGSPSEGPSAGVAREKCRRAANYGLTMDRMRELDAADGKRQPVYAFVEVGHPFGEADAPTITAEQIAGATMNSLIHEARGIIYFNHNFGGSCISQHVLRDGCGKAVRPAVTELNRRIATLAPVLNTQSYAWNFNAGLDTMLKSHEGSHFVFAMPGRDGGTGSQTLTLPPGLTGTSAEVLFENRSVPISGGKLQDTFAKESSYHIYKITP